MHGGSRVRTVYVVASGWPLGGFRGPKARRARHRILGEGVVVQEAIGAQSVVIRFRDGEREVPFGLGLVEVEVRDA